MNRYQNIPITKINGKQVYVTSRYPEVPVSNDDTYVFSVDGDRFDILALQFYNDKSLWWIIAIANTQLVPIGSLVIPGGAQIRIPANPQLVVNNFNAINQL